MDKQETAGKCGECEHETPARARKPTAPAHPDHSSSLKRLNRIKGQLDAVGRMIEGRKYCLDILQQIRAADSALRGLEAEILRGHLRGCVRKAFETKNTFEVNDRIEEILGLWKK